MHITLTALMFGLTVFPTVLFADPTFKTVCAQCHSGGIRGFLSGAPSVDNMEAWQPFLAKHSSGQMLEIVLHGSPDHKARGGCGRCTDGEVIEALRFMLAEVEGQ